MLCKNPGRESTFVYQKFLSPLPSFWLVKGTCDGGVSVCFEIFNMEMYVSNSVFERKHIWKHANIQNPVSLVAPNWGIGNPAQFKVFPEYCGRINRQEKNLKGSEKYPVSVRGWEWAMIHDDVYQFIFWVTVKLVRRYWYELEEVLEGEVFNLVSVNSNRQRLLVKQSNRVMVFRLLCCNSEKLWLHFDPGSVTSVEDRCQ